MPRGKAPTISKSEMTSVDALVAFESADYRIRHNARYTGWSDSKRLRYMLGKAFEAAIAARAGVHGPEELRKLIIDQDNRP